MWVLLLPFVSGSGCGKDASFTQYIQHLISNTLHTRSVDVVDSHPELGTKSRDYLVAFPSEATKKPAPVTFVFHGQYDGPEAAAERHQHFQSLAQDAGGIVVYPRGLGDGESGTGWNVGAHGDSTSCDASKARGASCYASCSAISACGPCDWSTCFDDKKFVMNMIQDLDDNACIDKQKMYIYGESNGGMMVYSLLQQMPGVFAAAVPEQGLPLVGYGPSLLEVSQTTSIFHRHDRQDTTVPMKGEISEDGWKYLSLTETLQDYCNSVDKTEPTAKKTEWDESLKSVAFSCSEYNGCSHGKNVVHCMYNGQHGDLPEDKARHDDTMVYKFLSLHSLPPPAALASSFLDGRATKTLRKSASAVRSLLPPVDGTGNLDGTFFLQ